jgi:hypothetical protein
METLEKPTTTVMDDAVLDALQQQPFSLLKEVAKLICIPRSTGPRYVLQTLGFVVKHLRGVPQSLLIAQREAGVTLPNERVRELWWIKHQESQFIVILDECWNYLCMFHERPWLELGERPPERPPWMMEGPKLIMTMHGGHSDLTCSTYFQKGTPSKGGRRATIALQVKSGGIQHLVRERSVLMTAIRETNSLENLAFV